jgi:hypothetical protein
LEETSPDESMLLRYHHDTSLPHYTLPDLGQKSQRHFAGQKSPGSNGKARISNHRNLLYNKDFYTSNNFHTKILRFPKKSRPEPGAASRSAEPSGWMRQNAAHAPIRVHVLDGPAAGIEIATVRVRNTK